MIKHIVMWKFKENTEKEMNEFLDGLKALENQIDAIKSMQIGKNIDNDEYDAILISEFESLEDLQKYKTEFQTCAKKLEQKELHLILRNRLFVYSFLNRNFGI